MLKELNPAMDEIYDERLLDDTDKERIRGMRMMKDMILSLFREKNIEIYKEDLGDVVIEGRIGNTSVMLLKPFTDILCSNSEKICKGIELWTEAAILNETVSRINDMPSETYCKRKELLKENPELKKSTK